MNLFVVVSDLRETMENIRNCDFSLFHARVRVQYHHPFFIPHRISVFICICSWVLINARMVQLKGVERISRISHQQAAEMLHLSSQMEAHE